MRPTASLGDRRLALLLCLLLAIGLAKGADKKDADTFPAYIPLEPPIIVNFADPSRARYLRVEVEFLVDTDQDAEAVNHHLPLIRDRMISLLAGRDSDQLTTTEARERLRADLLTQLRETMEEHAGTPAIGAIYFTGFIMQ